MLTLAPDGRGIATDSTSVVVDEDAPSLVVRSSAEGAMLDAFAELMDRMGL